MSPKNAIKMINIQKFYLVHIGSIRSIMSSSVWLGPIWSIWSYLVHFVLSTKVLFSPIQSYSIHFSLTQSIQSTLDLFDPHWSYSIHFSPIRSILSTLVLFGPFYPLWSYSVHYVYFSSILSYSVHIGPIRSILSTLIDFNPIWVIRSTFVLFGPFCPLWFLFGPFCPLRSYSVYSFLFIPIQSIWSTLFHLVQFGSFKSLQFILVHFYIFLCTYIMRNNMFALKTPNLNPNLLKKYKSQTRNI